MLRYVDDIAITTVSIPSRSEMTSHFHSLLTSNQDNCVDKALITFDDFNLRSLLSTHQLNSQLRHSDTMFHLAKNYINFSSQYKAVQQKCNGNFSGVELLWKPLDNNTYLIG